jgi:hypothetical protein
LSLLSTCQLVYIYSFLHWQTAIIGVFRK